MVVVRQLTGRFFWAVVRKSTNACEVWEGKEGVDMVVLYFRVDVGEEAGR